MLKKLLTAFFLLLLIVPVTTTVVAQSTNEELATEIISTANNGGYIVQINLPEVSITNRPSVFSVSPQFDLDTTKNIEYNWEFGDGNRDQGEEVVHSYPEPGNYNIRVDISFTEIETNSQINLVETEQIYVAQKFGVFITDKADRETTVQNFLDLAQKENISLQEIESYDSQSAFLSEEVLLSKLNEAKENIAKTDTIFVWTNSGTGLNALTRLIQADNEPPINLSNTTVILIQDTTDNLQRIERQFQQLEPKEIIAIQEAGFIPYLSSENLSQYKEILDSGGYDYAIINNQSNPTKPWLVLSYFLDFLSEKGIPDNVLILILLLPVIATVVAFLKQVIGIATLGLYTPTIITLAFLILGLEYGIVILLFMTVVSSLVYRLLKKLKLLHIPKMAILITVISLTIFAIFTLSLYLDILDTNFILLAVFPTVVIGTLLEKVVTARGSGFFKPILTILETIIVSIIAYIFAGGPINLFGIQIQMAFIQNFILNYPETILLIIVFNVILGRSTNLRLNEYIRFRDVIRNIEE